MGSVSLVDTRMVVQVSSAKRDKNQLLINDVWNAAVRTVGVRSQAVGTFVKSDSLKNIRGITQDGKNGDLFVTADNALYRITYTQRTVTLISGSPGWNYGYKDSTLLDSLFDWPSELIFIKPNTLLIADYDNNKLRDRKSTRLNSSHVKRSRMPSSA